jgi:hypothetical protein
VIGGEYGIRHGYGAAQAAGREVCAGVTIVGARLTGQRRRAIDYVDFVPLVLIGFAIEKDFAVPEATAQPPVAVVESTFTANNTVMLLDGSIVLRNAAAGQVALANPGNGSTAGKTVYLRRVYVTGTTRPVTSPACPRPTPPAGTGSMTTPIPIRAAAPADSQRVRCIGRSPRARSSTAPFAPWLSRSRGARPTPARHPRTC